MAIINSEIQMHSGDDKDLVFTIKDTAGAVIDITGAELRWALSNLDPAVTIKPAPTGSVKISKDNIGGGGAVITDGPSGVATITLLQTDTDALFATLYYYELEMVLTTKKSTVATGTLRICKDLVE